MTQRSAAERRVGRTLGGRYTLTRVLGVGGYGAVFEARHVLLDQAVAVKVIDVDDARPAAEARFLREARAAARIEHPSVVRVFDLGRDEAEGCLYLAQELVRGGTLRDWMEERLVATPREAMALLGPVMEGLAAAHAAGVVHRDVKPENVLLAPSPQGGLTPRVIDFGVAFLTARDEPTVTGDGAVGTPAYMAPEQARGARDLDARVDVWAVGVMLYELLLGRRPYDADGARALLAALAHAEPVRFARHAPEASAALCAVVERALAPSPDARFATVDALREALAACPEVRDPDARWAPRAAAATLPTQPEAPPSGEAPPRGGRGPRVGWVALVVVATLAALAALASLGGRRATPAPRVAARPRIQVAAAAPAREAPPVAPVVARDAEAPTPPPAVNARVRPPVRERVSPTPRGVARGVNGAPILAPPGLEPTGG